MFTGSFGSCQTTYLEVQVLMCMRSITIDAGGTAIALVIVNNPNLSHGFYWFGSHIGQYSNPPHNFFSMLFYIQVLAVGQLFASKVLTLEFCYVTPSSGHSELECQYHLSQDGAFPNPTSWICGSIRICGSAYLSLHIVYTAVYRLSYLPLQIFPYTAYFSRVQWYFHTFGLFFFAFRLPNPIPLDAMRVSTSQADESVSLITSLALQCTTLVTVLLRAQNIDSGGTGYQA